MQMYDCQAIPAQIVCSINEFACNDAYLKHCTDCYDFFFLPLTDPQPFVMTSFIETGEEEIDSEDDVSEHKLGIHAQLLAIFVLLDSCFHKSFLAWSNLPLNQDLVQLAMLFVPFFLGVPLHFL